jgi:methylenetetrahydrofolate--tRNA-(uracil-5-)-methyltransferase
MGLLVGIVAHLAAMKQPYTPPPGDTCVGALLNYITTENDNFQPMNINFGLVKNYNKREKERVVRNALHAISSWKEEIDKTGEN